MLLTLVIEGMLRIMRAPGLATMKMACLARPRSDSAFAGRNVR